MKKILATALALMLVFALAACGGNDTPDPSGSGDNAPGGSEQPQTPAPAHTEDPGGPADPTPPEEDGGLAGTRTMAYFQKYMSGGAYTYESRMEFDGMTTTTLSVTDGERMYTESETDGAKSMVIMKDGAMYILDPSTKTCIKMPLDASATQEVFADAAEAYETAVSSGDMEVKGETYFYEEFTVEGYAVTYCFDGEELRYMLMDMNGSEVVMEVLRMEAGADESLFEVPEDYNVLEY